MLNVVYKPRTKSSEAAAFDKVVADRRALCDSCDHKKVALKLEYCGLCKCPIRSKTSIRGASCPIGKW